MLAFNENDVMKHFQSVEDLFSTFFDIRYKYYKIRMDDTIGKMKDKINILYFKMKFLECVFANVIIISKKSKKINLIMDIHNKIENVHIILKSENVDQKSNLPKSTAYSCITSMPIYNLSREEYDKLVNQYKKEKSKLDIYKKMSIEKIWLGEIEELTKSMNIQK
jgi:hypothetical protein